MKAKISKYVERNKPYVIKLLSSLIEVPTVNPPGEHYGRIAALIGTECKKLGFKVKNITTPDNILKKYSIKNGDKRVNVVLAWNVKSKKTLHINCHYDVVPVGEEWKSAPFKARVAGNKIFGRGSEDMKGNIASVLFALKAVKSLKIKPNINIELTFTPDEEIGGATGLGYLVDKGLVRATYAMSEGYAGDYISIGNKGVLWAEVTVAGKTSHGSLPHLGVNSFERASKLAVNFMALKAKISKRKTRFFMKDNISKSPTLVMGGMVKGGDKVNIVPGATTFSIDRRIIPEETVSMAKKEIQDVIRKFNRKFSDSKASVKFITESKPCISKQDKVFFDAASKAIRYVTGKKPKFAIMTGATDMKYFMAKGVPSLGYNARGGDTWHSDNEFVYIDGLLDAAKVYALIMSELGN